MRLGETLDHMHSLVMSLFSCACLKDAIVSVIVGVAIDGAHEYNKTQRVHVWLRRGDVAT